MLKVAAETSTGFMLKEASQLILMLFSGLGVFLGAWLVTATGNCGFGGELKARTCSSVRHCSCTLSCLFGLMHECKCCRTSASRGKRLWHSSQMNSAASEALAALKPGAFSGRRYLTTTFYSMPHANFYVINIWFYSFRE
jgi:hypothetical protein